MKDNFDGLGIFFDTYKHNRPGTVFPYVMAMLGDGKTPYDKANDGKANEIVPGCTARGLRNPGVEGQGGKTAAAAGKEEAPKASVFGEAEVDDITAW